MLGLVEAVLASQTVSNTEAGTFTVASIVLSGADTYTDAAEAGTFTATFTLSGSDIYVYAAETGTITATVTLSGADEYGETPASTVTFLRDRHHNVVQAG